MRDRIGYLHVPKAAGMSITNALTRAAESSMSERGRTMAICPTVMDRSLFGSFDDFESFADAQRSMVLQGPREELGEYPVVIGHFNAGSLRVGRDADDIAVLLREPRARLLSLYTFWRSWTEAEHASWGSYDASRRAASRTWAEFLHDAAIAPQIDNVVARLVLGPHPLVPVDGFIPAAAVDQVAEEALEALEQLGFVDVVENDAACWSRLGAWAQLTLVVGVMNETSSEPPEREVWDAALEAPTLDALRRRTEIDRRLWIAAASPHSNAHDDLDDRAAHIAASKFSSFGLELPRRVGATRVRASRRWWRPQRTPRAAE
ncbi:MAG TPA: hypothetical protein VMY16_11610 [Ilumatobacteraceae bacterium]|nr:hypothetical protein [Ilumatobacteraceae bacterium]